MLTSAQIGRQNGDTRTRKLGYLNLSYEDTQWEQHKRKNITVFRGRLYKKVIKVNYN
jgi:hypothetical protein